MYARRRRPVQPRFEFLVAEPLDRRPVQPGGAGQRRNLAGRALGQTERAAALGIAASAHQVQPQQFSQLTHRDPRCGHRSLKKAASVGRPVGSPACTRTVHDPAETPSTITLKQRPRSP
jgi:hypothetical protein